MEHVVVIDSDPNHSREVQDALASAGYEVTVAKDGMSGLELVREKKPKVAIVDIFLPELHGFAVCHEICSSPSLRRQTKVIVASVKSYHSDIRRALNLGAVDYLVKPFPTAALVKAVQDALKEGPTPANEISRVATLHGYQILDTEREQVYDDVTLLASVICGTPVALISLIDADRQWFKSSIGTELKQTSRDLAFCAHTIMNSNIFEVEDARQDERFQRNVLVTLEPKIRFYAGAPIVAANGDAMGTVCVIDTVPRELTQSQREGLKALSRLVQHLLSTRKL